MEEPIITNLLIFEIFLGTFGIRFHRLFTRFPIGGTNWKKKISVTSPITHSNQNFRNSKTPLLPSPCLSVNWNAWTKRNVSSTERPTGRSFIVTCLRTPLSSIMNKPRNGTPVSSLYTPYALAMLAALSANKGMFILPRPPSFLGVFTHAKWQKWLSVEAATTSHWIFRNSSNRSEKAIISVGHTKVLKTKVARLILGTS